MVTVKADDRSRVKLPGVKPGQVFSWQSEPDGSIRLVEVVPKDVPVVKPIKTKEGFLIWPVKFDGKQAAAAIRSDRNDQ